jgi:SAM-dependent methyltransferase
MEGAAQVVSDRLVELAEVQPGQRVLDIATGIGEPAVTAARRVGPTGRVVATDQAPQMLAIARERAAELGLHNLDFVEVDAEALDFPARSFDAVLSRWGLMFLPNLPGALARIHRVLTPGGRLAAAVWGPPPNVPLISVAMGTVREQVQAAPPPPGVPGPFSLADAMILEQTLSEIGFDDVRSERLTAIFEWASAEDYTRFQQAIAAPIIAMVEAQPVERRAGIWQAVTDAARQRAGADGRVRMANEVFCVIGHR